MAGSPVALGALSLTPRPEYKKPKVKQDKAAYGVINNGFFDENDKFWHPGQMLYFNGEPNQNLYPLNKLAYDRMQAFLDKLDMLGEEVAKKNKKTYVRQPRQEWTDDSEVELPQVEHVMGIPRKEKNEEIR
jgi:hypothetical protein